MASSKGSIDLMLDVTNAIRESKIGRARADLSCLGRENERASSMTFLTLASIPHDAQKQWRTTTANKVSQNYSPISTRNKEDVQEYNIIRIESITGRAVPPAINAL